MRLEEIVDRLRAAGCVFAEQEAALLLESGGDVADLVGRREAGEPLEVLLGWVSFAGLRLAVGPGVFVPRRRTELLAREAVAGLRPDDVLVELCCGVAPVAATVAAALPDVELHAGDIDPAAIPLARQNLPRGEVHLGDLYAALPGRLRGRVGVLAANTPYVPTAHIAGLPPEARLHEPRHALDGGPDGLALLRRLAADATSWLRPGGRLLVEVIPAQLPAAEAAYVAGGLAPHHVRDDALDATVAVGVRPDPTA